MNLLAIYVTHTDTNNSENLVRNFRRFKDENWKNEFTRLLIHAI